MERDGRGGLPVKTLRAMAAFALVATVACAADPGDGRGDDPSQDSGAAVSAASVGGAPGVPGDAREDIASEDSRDGRGTVLFVGTSLTAGLGLEPEQAYPHLIQQKIDSARLSYRVVNAGVSGETSSALLRRIPWLLRQPFDVMVLETGANDGLRGIPVSAMRRNIQLIIDSVRVRRPDARILLVQMEAPPNLGVAYTSDFRETFPELARENDLILLPFLLDGVAGVRAMNQGDGIHPNPVGSQVVAENVWRGLRAVLR